MSLLKRCFYTFVIILFSSSAVLWAQSDKNELLLIQNGKIVNGTGEPAFRADILIEGDRIAFIGEINADSLKPDRVIDATGRIVSPGFIDMHAHGNPLSHPEFQNFIAMGVTTIVLGQDGSSPTQKPFSEWFEEVQKANPSVNIAALVGHGSLRRMVDLGEDKTVHIRDLNAMEQKLEQSLKQGAFGMSLGLEYVPGLYADSTELSRLAKVVGKYDGVIMSHVRSEDDSQIEASLNELAGMGAFARVHASHLKVVYGKGKERAQEILNQISEFNRSGMAFTADTYPYEASFTGIGIVFPKWAKTTAQWKQVMAENPELLREFLQSKVKQRNGADAILFGTGKYAGHTLAEAAQKEGISPVDYLLKIGPNGASAAHFVMNEELQDNIAVSPEVMISSDGSPTMRHPRGYGSFAKIIRKYVVEQQALFIEQAVHKMSGLSAQTLQLEDRGTLAVGKKADVIIFDPNNVKDTATFPNPHELAEGFEWVIVNGEIAKQGDEFANKRSGVVLKKNTD